MNLRKIFRLPYVLIALALIGPVFLLPKVMRSTAAIPPAAVEVLPAAAPYKATLLVPGALKRLLAT